MVNCHLGHGDRNSRICRYPKVPAMPHIDSDIKLDFKDVLLRPKRSTLKSRSEVDLTRSFSFRNSKQMYTGIPIIAANMDTVGTFEMAKVICKVGFPLCRFLTGDQLCGLTAEVICITTPTPGQLPGKLTVRMFQFTILSIFSNTNALYLVSSKAHLN